MAVLVAASLLAAAPGLAVADTPGGISGTVTDAVTHNPLKAVTVSLYNSSDSLLTTTTTAADGNYAFSNLTAGTYELQYVSPANYTPQFYDGKDSLATATPVTVTDGTTTTGIDAGLAAGGKITGTVSDGATNAALANVIVSVYDSSQSFLASTQTATDGTYTLQGLSTGTYEVQFSPTSGSYTGQFYNGKSTLASADPVSVTAGSTTSSIDVGLTPSGGQIAGKVTDAATHTPQVGAEVDIYNSGGGLIDIVHTATDGTYTSGAVTPGTYEVGFKSSANLAPQFYNGKTTLATATPVTVSAGATTPAINAALAAGGRITGTVTDAATHAALSSVQITLYDASGNFLTSLQDKPDGTYSLQGLATGTYEVGFSASGYTTQFYDNQSALASATTISVTAGSSASGVDAAMASSFGKISGTVTDVSTGTPLAHVEVEIYRSGSLFTSTLTVADGTYKAINLPAGDYQVGFKSSANYAPRFYDDKDTLASADTVTVSAGATSTGIDGALASGARITGTITDAATHAALKSATATLYDSSDTVIGSTQTAVDGSYQFSGLAAGTYEVGFSDSGYVNQWYNGEGTLASADSITVAAASTKSSINAALVANNGQISGTVTDATTHAAVSGVVVDAYNLSQTLVGSTTTAADGTYTLAGLPAGSYLVGFASPTGSYISQIYNGQPGFIGATSVPVSAAAPTGGIDAALASNAAKISGTVTDATTHAAIKGILVQAYDSSDQPVGAAVKTDASGKYTLGLAAGNYEVGFTTVDATYTAQFYDGQSTLSSATPVAATAGSTKSGVDAAMSASTGRITGTVTTASSHVPLAGVQVELFREGSAVNVAFTAADGTYSFSNLTTDTYQVEFIPSGNFLTQFYNGKATLATATAISVTTGSTTSAIDGALATGGQITGTVTDATTHAALPSTTVELFDASTSNFLTSTTTAPDGTYTLAGLSTGSYKVEFAANGGYLTQFYNGKSDISTADSIAVSAGSTKSGVDAALVASVGQISGTVTDQATDTPQANVIAEAFTSSDSFFGSTVTASDGTYTLANLAPGTYEVEFISPANFAPQFYNKKTTIASASAVTVTAGGTTTGIDGSLVAGGQITGTVTDSITHGGLPNAGIVVQDATSENTIATATTGPDGTYTIQGLASGSYTVQFATGGYTTQFYDGKDSFATADPVAVTAGSTMSGIDGSLTPLLGTLTGKVTDAASHVPVSGVTVTLFGSGGFAMGSAVTAADGTYTLSSVTPGTYTVGFTPVGNYLPQFFNGKSSSTSATPVTVTAGATTTGINAALAAAGKLTGTVTDAQTHAALGQIAVNLYDSTGSQIKTTTTAADGTYGFVGLQTGSYEVGFSSPGNYFAEFYDGEASLANADSIAVAAGSTTTGIDAELTAPSRITGTVTDAATSSPVSGVEVDVYDSAQNLVGITNTLADGTYTVTGLVAGTYEVGFVPTGNFLPQFYDAQDSLASATPVTVAAGGVAKGIDAALAPGGQITGTVTDASNADPIAGVEVDVYDSSENFVTTTQTAADGTYTVPGLTTGTYEVGFTTNGDGNYVDQFYHGKASLDTATPVSVTTGSTTPGINAALATGGQISGTVTDSSSEPLSAEVDVYDVSGDLVTTTETAVDGTYAVGGLPSGTYEVGFSPDDALHTSEFYDNKATLASATPVTVTAGSTTSGIDAQLDFGAQIEGTVTDGSSGTLLANIEVDVYDSAGNFVTATATDGNGHYTVNGLVAGDYKIGFAPTANYTPQFYNDKASLATADTVSVTAGSTTDGIDGVLTPSSGQISGTVTDGSSHTVLSGVEVDLYDSAGDFVSSTSTGDDGTYTFSGLGSGTYEVGFAPSTGGYAPQFYKGKATLASADPVNVTAGTTTSGIDGALVAGGQISGTVTNASGGVAMANVEVDLFDSTDNFIDSTETAADGTYSFSGLGAGPYEVGFTPTGSFSPQFYNGQSSLVDADPVTVKLGKTTPGIDAALAAGGQISGTVTDAVSAAPLQGVEIDVYDSGDGFVTSTTTAADGTYTVSGLPAGSYEVGFVPSGNLLPQFYDGKDSLANASAVTVTAGDTTTGIDAALSAGGDVSGTVTDAAASGPLAGVEVDVYDSADDFVASTNTGADGTYTVSGLPAGSYEVGFALTGNFLPQYYNGKDSLATADQVSVTSGSTTSGIDAALVAGGQISGAVTDASSHDPVANVEVDVYDGSGTLVAFTDTAADGTYTVPGLAAGTYNVGYVPADETYSPQFYNDKPSLATADPVSVTTGATTSRIDAALVPGASISGTVTNASSNTGLAHIEVDVYDSGQNFVTSTETGSDGTYQVSGLAAGSYEVGFVSAGNFSPQFYNDQTTLAAADTVSIAAGSSTTGIDAALAVGGQITGAVTDAATTDPLDGVEVDLYDSSLNFLDSTQTGSDGTYTFSGLPTGSYEIGFSPSTGGYAPLFYNGKGTLASATGVAVTAGATTSAINGALSAGGQIAGTVTNASSHDPLANVEVDVYDSAENFVTSTDTAADGTYTVSGLTAGSYEVGFVPTGNFAPQFYNAKVSLASATPVTVTGGSTTDSIDAALGAGGQISGTVSDAVSHDPVGNVEVDLYDSSDVLLTSTQTLANGKYTFSGLAAGTYEVGFAPSTGGYLVLFYNGKGTLASASSVTVTAAHTTSGIDAALVVGGKIAGTVTDSSTSAPIGSIEVDLYDSTGAKIDSTTTLADGTYRFSALAAGSYKVGFTSTSGAYAAQFYNGKSTLAAADPVAVTAASETSGIDASLTRVGGPSPGTITGTVTDAATHAALQGIQVQAYDTAGTKVGSAVATNASGSYTLSLDAGSYKVGFASTSGAYTAQFYNAKSTLASADAVSVTASHETAGINAALVAAPGKITGTVTDAATHAGLSGIQVQTYDSSGKKVGTAIATGAGGTYALSLAAGSYKVGFASTSGAYVAQFYSGKTSVASASTVTVKAGATTASIDAALTPVPGQISGAVSDASSHAPLSGISVQAYAGGVPVGAAVLTTASGGYVMTLSAGTYEISFSSPIGAYVTQFFSGQASLATATPVVVKPGATSTGVNAALAAASHPPPPPPVPQISALKLSNKKFSAGSRSGHGKHGTVFSFGLNTAAAVKITVEQKSTGRKGPKGCAPQTHRNRHKHKCTLILARGTITAPGIAGANSVTFSGTVGGHTLKAGKYQALASATNSSGTSTVQTLSFTIVKAKKPRHHHHH